MNNILGAKCMEDFIRMTQEGVAQGWHERNGGNLSYRLTEYDASQIKLYLEGEPGEWKEIGTTAAEVAGEYFIVTGSGKYFQNVETNPEDNICIIEVNDIGDKYRIVWGLAHGGRPTSELPTHLMNHAVRKRVTNGANRVIYHAHTPNIIALTAVLPQKAEVLTRVLWKSATECCVVFPSGVAVVPWMVPGGADIAVATCKEMEKYEAAVWSFHGLFVSGPDFDTAFGLMHTIEKAAEVACIILSCTGGKRPMQVITDDELRAIGKEFGVKLNEDVLNFKSDDDMWA